ncbi:MAG: VOC family protein [Gammaproteobacteria bacterium]|nr:VOC family protein [Gammaproteobacteria bacterium]
MAILSVIPVLNCQSIETTLKFYQQLLQFVVVKKRDMNGRLYWVHLMHGDTTLMLQSVPGHDFSAPVSDADSKITLYFFVNNIDDLHHFIKAKSNDVPVIKETDYQIREFSIIDPEGNTVTIGMRSRQKQQS